MIVNMSWPYIAGFLDCDGSICIVYGRIRGRMKNPVYDLRITLYSQNMDVLSLIKSFVGYGSSVHTCGLVFSISFSSMQAVTFLRSVLPYLHTKKSQAELGIRHVETYKANKGARLSPEVLASRRWFYEEMKRLNASDPIRIREIKASMKMGACLPPAGLAGVVS